MKLFFFDTETTGLNPGIDRIIQFGGIFGTLNEKTFEFTENQRINQLINVDVKIPEEVSAVHGIQNQDLEGFGYIDDYIYEFLALVKKADLIIGHNISFDCSMLKGETERLGIPFDFEKIKLIDTMKPTAELVNGKGGKWPRLMDLYKFLFGKEFDNAHNAMADIEATKDCFIELVKKYDIYDEICPKPFVDLEGYENQRNLTSLTDEQAEHLSNLSGKHLRLEKLTTITDKQAEYLSKFNGESIELNGLTTITDKQAEHLSKFKGESIELNGLTTITDKQAEYLSKFNGTEICLDGLTTITDKQAKSFLVEFCLRAIYTGYNYHCFREVTLKGLETITDKQAELFSNLVDKDLLYLPIKTITDKQAEYLSKFKGDKLHLDGLTKLSDKQSKSLARFFGFSLSLSGLTILSDEQMENISNSSAEVLYLDGLKSMTDKQAEYLSKYDGSELFLEGLESITKSQKEILSKYRGEIHLSDEINIQ